MQKTSTESLEYELLPEDKRNVLSMIRHELNGKPIILKNGAEGNPYGWRKFYKVRGWQQD